MKKVFALLIAVVAVIAIWAGLAPDGVKATPAIASPAPAQTFDLDLGHIQPADHLIGKFSDNFANSLRTNTNGAINIRVFPASQLGTAGEQTDAIVAGNQDIFVFALGTLAQWYPPFGIIEFAYVFDDRDMLMKAMNSDFVMKEMAEAYTNASGLRYLAPMYYGTAYLTTKNIAVQHPRDLQGVKIRAALDDANIASAQTLGATPVPIAYGELYMALQQGLAEGQSNPPMSIAAMKFYEVQKYLVETKHYILPNFVFINEDVYQSMGAELQNAFQETAAACAEEYNAEAFAAEDECIKDLTTTYGMTLIQPDLAPFRQNAAEIVYPKFIPRWGEGTLEKIRAAGR